MPFCFFRQPETCAKPIYQYNKYKCYRVGILAHQPPDRAEFPLISINNQRLSALLVGKNAHPIMDAFFCFRLSFAKISGSLKEKNPPKGGSKLKEHKPLKTYAAISC